MLDKISASIDEVEDRVSVLLFSRCEHTNLIHGAQVAQSLLQMLPQSDIKSNRGWLVRLCCNENVELDDPIIKRLVTFLEILGLLRSQFDEL